MNAVSAWYYTDPYYHYTYQYALRAQYGTQLNQPVANTQTQDISIYDNNNIIKNNTNDDSKQLVSYKNSMDISFNAWKLRYKILEELFNKYTENSTRITFEQCVDLYMDLYKTENTPLACQYTSLTYHIAGKEFHRTLSLDNFLYSYREMYKWL